jgi:hypothetical protein
MLRLAGIDLGTTNSVPAAPAGGRVVVVPSPEGDCPTRSAVAAARERYLPQRAEKANHTFPTTSDPEGEIVAEVQKCYLYAGELLRPARDWERAGQTGPRRTPPKASGAPVPQSRVSGPASASAEAPSGAPRAR